MSGAGLLAAHSSSSTSVSDNAAGLVSLFNHVGILLIGLGAVTGLISFAIGATMVMGSAGHADRVKRGMSMIKNAIIGFLIVGMGAFLRIVVTTMIKPTTEAASATKTTGQHQEKPVPAQHHTAPVHHHPVHIPWLWIGVSVGAIGAASILGKLSRALYRRRLRRIEQHEAKLAWAKMIGEPGEDGPIDPEEGYEIIAAEKHEHLDEELKRVIVNFHAGRYRFEHRHWVRTGLADKAVTYEGPRSFNLDDDAALASAWFDYSEACAEVNRAAWAAREDEETSERAEAQVEQEELHDEAVELMTQRAALQALPGPTFTSDAVDHVLAEAKLKPRTGAGKSS